MEKDFSKLAQKIAEAARQGVQVERLWQEKLEAELRAKQQVGSTQPCPR